MVKEKMRFAGLARVSGESQVKKKDFINSLKMQRRKIELAVEELGGNPKGVIWDYSGQESTLGKQVGTERRLLTALEDEVRSGHPRFDAVMVAFLNRVGRDAETTLALHNLLVRHGIAFYELETRRNIRESSKDLRGVGHEAVEGQASKMDNLDASMEEREARALEMGKCTAGKWVGRIWNEKAGKYEADPVLVAKVDYMVNEILAGTSMYAICDALKLQRAWAYKLLRKARPTLTFKLKCHELLADKYPGREITITGPALCSDVQKLEQAIAKVEGNRSRFRVSHKGGDPWPLQGFLRCAHCNYAMVPYRAKWKNLPDEHFVDAPRARKRGVEEVGTRSYYRHNVSQDAKGGCYKPGMKGPKAFPFHIPARKLEDAVVKHLFTEALDPKEYYLRARRELRKRNGGTLDEIKIEMEKAQKALDQVKKERDNLILMGKKGLADIDTVVIDAKRAEAQVRALQRKIDDLQGQLDRMPSEESLEAQISEVERIREQVAAASKIVAERPVEEWTKEVLDSIFFDHAFLRALKSSQKVPYKVIAGSRIRRKAFERLFGASAKAGVFIRKHADGSLMVEVRKSEDLVLARFKL